MDILETADGGFITMGVTSSYGSGGQDLLVIRTDSLGRRVWSKTYGGSSDEGIVPIGPGLSNWATMLQTADSTYVITSATKSYGAGGYDVYLVKIDKNGNVLWSRTYGGSGDDAGIQIIPALDGGFIITGETSSIGKGNKDVLFIKTNDTGGVVWTKAFGGTDNDFGYNVKATLDSFYVISGETYSFGAGNGDYYILKTDKAGKLIWSKTYGGSSWDIAFGACELPDRSIYISGQTQSFVTGTPGSDADAFIVKLDSSGTVKWGKNIGTTSREGVVELLYKNGLFHTAGFSFKPGSASLLYLRLDTSGAVKVFRTYGGAGYTHHIKSYHDGGFYLSTGTNAFGSGNYDVYMLRMDSAAKTNGCNSTDYSYSVSKNTPSVTTPATTVTSDSFTVKSITSAVKSVTPSEFLKCEPFVSHFSWKNACTNQNTQFYDSTYINSQARTWNFGDPSSGSSNTSTLKSPTHKYTSAGTYSVKLIVEKDSAFDSVAYTVTVQDIPTANISRTDTTICLGDSVQLSTSASSGTFYWSPGQYLSDSLSATPWAFPAANTNFVLRVTNGSGCSNYDTVKITIDTSGTKCTNLSKVSGVINKYASVSSIDTCYSSIAVDTTSFFVKGDKALLIQMQEAGNLLDSSNSSNFGKVSAYKTSGQHEYIEVDSVGGGKIYARQKLANQYNISTGTVQLVRIPKYVDLNVQSKLTAQPWNGKKGGILIFEASGNVFLNSDIDVSGKGFRGGTLFSMSGKNCGYTDYFYNSTSVYGANKGEGAFIIRNKFARGRGAHANGGGGGNSHNAGGGGGANYGEGGTGGKEVTTCSSSATNGGIGGRSLAPAYSSNRLFLGGGGGAGHRDNDLGTPGTNGGGMVIINSKKIYGNGGKIYADGLDQSTNSTLEGAGGGGGGGSIILNASSIVSNIPVSAKGGKGGDIDFSYCHGPGGGGGGGMVWAANAASTSNLSTNVSGGAAGKGITSSGCTGNHGSSAGVSGDVLDDSGTFSIVTGPVFVRPYGASLTTYKKICLGDSIQLEASGGVKYEWSPGIYLTDSTVAKTWAYPSKTTKFQVKIFNNKGCYKTDTVTIAIDTAGCTNLTIVSGVINKYASVKEVDTCFFMRLLVDTSSYFKKGDKALLIQMKGAVIDSSNSSDFGKILDYKSAGNYEVIEVDSVGGKNVYPKYSFKNTYDAGAALQLVRIPVYTDLYVTGTLTAQPWNGKKGGVLIFEATGLVYVSANIDVSGKGFRGGDLSSGSTGCHATDYYYDNTSTKGTNKGEGIAVTRNKYARGRGANANGGGGGGEHNSGGGGGANNGSGGEGGKEWSGCSGGANTNGGLGGNSLSAAHSKNKIFLGGGGGAGHSNDNQGTPGTAGGGIVLITAGRLDGTTILVKSNGIDQATVAGSDGSGGGGAGGTILLSIEKFNKSLEVQVNGGKGGNNNFGNNGCVGPGGGGGGGLVWVKQTAVSPLITIQSNGGKAGIQANSSSPCYNTSFGAAAGASGGSLTSLVIPQSSSIFTPPAGDVVSTYKKICLGDSVQLEASGGVKYEWSPGVYLTDSTEEKTWAHPDKKTTFTVRIYNSKGCYITDTVTVNVDTAGCTGFTKISGVINNYSQVTSIDTCANSVVVDTSSFFKKGDLALLIQMQGVEIDTSNNSSFGNIAKYNSAGNYEYVIVDSIKDKEVFFKHELSRKYDASGSVQLVTVPQYTDVLVTKKLTAQAWNSANRKGGVLIFKASGRVYLYNDIDVTGSGFNGGKPSYQTTSFSCSVVFGNYFYPSQSTSGESGDKGRGIVILKSRIAAGKGKAANGGGGGNQVNAGGGGGANYGDGGSGGKTFSPCSGGVGNALAHGGVGGSKLSYSGTEQRVFMGGGGGGGQQNDSKGKTGTNGGGIIIIDALKLYGGSKNIISNGPDNTVADGDGGGGGGAGGTILLNVDQFAGNFSIQVKGGKGSNQSNNGNPQCHGTGGGGGGGAVWFKTSVPGGTTISIKGGEAGLITGPSSSSCYNTTYGADSGRSGGVLSGLTIPQSTKAHTPPAGEVITLPQVACKGDSIQLIASGGVRHRWFAGASPLAAVDSPWTVVNAKTTYKVNIYNDQGCFVSDSVAIDLKLSPTLKTVWPKCISVVNDSTVTFSWGANFGADTAYFGEYRIYRRPGDPSTSKPFKLYDVITDWKVTGYSDTKAYHADTGSYGYMVVAVNSCGKDNLSGSTSISSMVLKSKRISDRRVKLLWNHVSFSKFYDREYVVEADTGTGFNKLFSFDDFRIGSGTSTIVYDCGLNARFRVSGRDTAKSCKSFSSITPYVKLADVTAPAPPVIRHVTIDNWGKITLVFHKSDSADVKSYTVLRSVDGGTFSVSEGINVVSPDIVYTIRDTPIFADFRTYCYKVIATDSCGNSTTSVTHCAVNLGVTVGNLKHTLKWEPYQGFASTDYIRVQRWNAAAKKWDSIGYTSGTAKTYIDSANIRCNNSYIYRITTFEKGGKKGVSHSDSVRVKAYDSIPPKKLQIKGASVTGPGEITLSWSATTDTDLDSFRVFASVNGGTYKKIGGQPFVIGISNFTFVHSGINPQKDSYCYYIQLKDTCAGFSTNSDTHCVVQLTATKGNKEVKLSWSKYQGYEIDKYNVQQWMGTKWETIATTLNDTLTVQKLYCNTWYRFRIEAVEKGGNTFTSISDTAWARPFDTIRPPQVNIRYATVISASSIQLVAEAVADDDVTQYEIFASKNGGPYSKLTTLPKPGSGIITYTHTGINPSNDRYCYQIWAVDSCADNRSATSETHCAILLGGTAGNYENNLSWTKYRGFDVVYYILQRYDGVKTRIDTLSATDSTFRDSLINCNTPVQYYLYAQDKNNSAYESEANILTLTPFDTVKPQPPVLDYVTVTGKSIILNWQKSPSNDVKDYAIYRQVSGGGTWTKINTVRDVFTYTDTAVDADANSYCYQLIAVDSCAKNLSIPTAAHCAVRLQAGTTGCERDIDLQWNAYAGWAGVDKYEVYRAVDGGSESLLAALTASTTSYSDTGLDFHKRYAYRIKAYQQGGSFVSWSNDTSEQTYVLDTAVIRFASKISTSFTTGRVLIKWKSQAAIPHMSYHRLYYATAAAGPFTQIGGNIPVSKDSFVHTNVNTRSGEHYYYIENIDSCGTVSDKSSTHKTIDLEVNIGQLIHDLSWTPYQGFDVKGYYLQRVSGGKFVDLDTLPATDTANRQFPAPCNFNIIYRLAAFDGEGNIAYSDTMGRIALDTVFANAARINNLTVINDNSTQLGFRGSDSLDVYAYTIQRAHDGLWGTSGQVLFTTAGDTHSYTDTVDTRKQQLCYTIITLDSCLNVTYSDTFCAIQMKGQEVNLGNVPAWHPFKGYPIGKYSLLQYNGTGWDTLTTTTSDTSFAHNPLPCNVPVSYRVAGEETGGSRITLSDTVTLVPWDTIRPLQPVTYYATVRDGSTIDLFWEKSADPDVKKYELSFRTEGSAWTAHDTVGTLSYTFTGLNTLDSTYSFRIRAIDSCAENESEYGVIHSPVQLKGKPLNLSNELTWSEYKGFISVKKYYIYWLDNGSWQILDSTDAATTAYLHTPLSCNVPRYYKIKTVEGNNAFTSWSDSIRLTPWDTIKPPQPVTYYSTVVDGSAIDLFWEKSVADVKLYEVSVKSAGTAWKVADTVTNLSFRFTGLNTPDSAYSFRIRAIDSCAENASIFGVVHSPVQLKGTALNLSNQLDWPAYEGFDSIRKHYVYHWQNSSWSLLDSTGPATTTFTHKPLPCNVPQYYKIMTLEGSGKFVSWSDSIMLTPFDTIKPDKPFMHNASVQDDGTVKLAWHWDTTSEVKYFEIWRRPNFSLFSKIATVTYDSVYVDSADAGKDAYSYYVIAIDSCDVLNRSVPSDTDRIMNLTLATGGCVPLIKLDWTSYSDLRHGVDAYVVHRSEDGVGFSPVKTLPGSTLAWVDSTVLDNVLYFYKIEAVDNESIYTSFSDTMGLMPWRFPVPGPAQMVYTTVERTGKNNGAIRVEWTPYDNAADTFARGYQIYHRQGNGAFKLLYRQTGFASSSLVHKGINTVDSIHTYYVAVFNLCDIEGVRSASHVPVNLDVENRNLEASLTWNSYLGDTVSRYELIRIHNGATPRVIRSFAANDTSYLDSGLLCDHDYVYVIKSILQNGSESLSDTVKIKAYDTIPPARPDLLYISVDTSHDIAGKISMRFIGNNEPNRSGYRIYRGIDGGKPVYHTTLQSTRTGIIFWEDINLNTRDNKYTYYFAAIDSCGNESLPSDTHTQVFLTVKAQSLFNKLDWTAYLGWKAGRKYILEKQSPGKNWLMIDTVPGMVTTYHDSDVICHQFYSYRIRSIEEGETWVSFSNTTGDTAFETEVPEPPVIRFATVDSTHSRTGRVLIYWDKSISPDARFYNLYRSTDGTNWNAILTGFAGLQYLDAALNTAGISYYYRVESIDSCGNVGSPSAYHRTIHLSTTPGNGEMQLTWTPYIGWPVKQYIIIRDAKTIDTVSGNITEYIDSLILCRRIYSYQVMAIADLPQLEISVSNYSVGKASNTKKPKRAYLKFVTVSTPNNEVSLAWDPSPTFDVKHYYIYLRSAKDGRFRVIDSTDKLFYTYQRDTIEESDCYFITAKDNCGNESELSNRGCIIILKGSQEPQRHRLTWNEYSLWKDGVNTYKVYKEEDNFGWKEIGSATIPEYFDNAIPDTVNRHCYQVEAIENAGTHNATSSSTVFCLYQDPVVFVPNIFSPGISHDINDRFGPKGLYVKTYRMQIYNRWGMLIYETDNGTEWDGTYDGKVVPEGVYLYVISLDGFNKQVKQRLRGTVTILR